MRLKFPKNNEKILWTKHAKGKIQYYQLSEKRVKRVLRNPKRVEKGIAPETIAVMQPTGTKKYPTEIWVMYQAIKSKIKNRVPIYGSEGEEENEVLFARQKSKIIKIISAWRYPGKSPLREPPPIPEDTLIELKRIIQNQ